VIVLMLRLGLRAGEGRGAAAGGPRLAGRADHGAICAAAGRARPRCGPHPTADLTMGHTEPRHPRQGTDGRGSFLGSSMIAGDGRINSLLTDRRPGPLAPCSGARMSGCGVERGGRVVEGVAAVGDGRRMRHGAAVCGPGGGVARRDPTGLGPAATCGVLVVDRGPGCRRLTLPKDEWAMAPRSPQPSSGCVAPASLVLGVALTAATPPNRPCANVPGRPLPGSMPLSDRDGETPVQVRKEVP
jgi:hypothetical protein